MKRVTIHGLRHTSATLLLKAGVPAQVVQQRLGHKPIEITHGIYAHVLPSMQQDAAQRLGGLLYGDVRWKVRDHFVTIRPTETRFQPVLRGFLSNGAEERI